MIYAHHAVTEVFQPLARVHNTASVSFRKGYEGVPSKSKEYHAIVSKTRPLRSPPATNSSGGVSKILAHGPICVGGVSKILRNSSIWPRGVSKILEQTCPNFVKTLFSKAKTLKNYRALRARGDLKSPNFPICLEGFQKISPAAQFALEGF